MVALVDTFASKFEEAKTSTYYIKFQMPIIPENIQDLT
jgi:hypothetical protein